MESTIKCWLCLFLSLGIVSSQPFGTEWSEIDQQSLDQSSDDLVTETLPDDPSAKEKIAEWILRKIEHVILKKVKETSFVDLITGSNDEQAVNNADGGRIQRDDANSSNSQIWAVALVLFVVAFGVCIWCVFVRHLLRGVVVVLSVAFFLFFLIALVYPVFDTM